MNLLSSLYLVITKKITSLIPILSHHKFQVKIIETLNVQNKGLSCLHKHMQPIAPSFILIQIGSKLDTIVGSIR
jgi:hypothetical protein